MGKKIKFNIGTATAPNFVGIDAENSETLGGLLPSDFVQTSQIKNTLTETVAGNALDASQGKVLNERLCKAETAISSNLAESVKVELSEKEPLVSDENTYWYKIGSFSGGTGGGDGVSVANAVTGDNPPEQSQYWFDTL